ncbi:enolase C-terminal domain-like protein [Hygrophoropsis aurantiaca]|uniref:Enolase C-terminal domain-like protein n=1 Tax=Hygrophoropsis aurantiaca TaxID=72124 RepID=A0ACB8A717_9AGAM|nr:enolase C-terminal domain-like protein [Hygrophoropsis aurantiaca]
MSEKTFPTITAVKTYLIGGQGDGADYHSQSRGHWIIDTPIANPMSRYSDYKTSRVQWGIDVLGTFCVELHASDGTTGFATGLGGPPACWIVQQHLKRFLVGADPRDTNLLWDQMYNATLFYGRKGLPVAVISCVDLAIWDLLGKIRGEPVYKLIGGRTKEHLSLYSTGPLAVEAQRLGFWGGKVPLPYGPDEVDGLRKNYEFLAEQRRQVGPDFPLMVDCYMSLTVQYAIELATKCLPLNINWWEEVLHPDDEDGFKRLKAALPQLKWTTGEHEYTRYGFRKLLETRSIDILQPDVTWVGGLTELLKISAHAAAYDIPVVPHASSCYSYHFALSQTNTPFAEIVCNAPDGKSVQPSFGKLFLNEPVPRNGRIEVSDLAGPGFGLKLNPDVKLIDAEKALTWG